MERGDVASFVEDATTAIADAPEMGARNTQLRVVEPFLAMLGWDVRSRAVEAAYAAANETVVDYALRPDDRPGVFVLVAGCDESLARGGRDELVAAMRASNVDRGVYTNGRRYLLVALAAAADSNDGGVEQVRLELDALPEHVDALRAVHRETVAASTGGSRRVAAESLVDADDAAIRAVTEAVVDVVDDDVADGTVAPVVTPLARRFLDAVVDELAPEMEMGALRPARANDATGPTESDTASTGEGDETEAGDAPSEVVGSAATDEAASGPPATDEAASGGTVSTLAERSEARDCGDDDSEYVVRFFEDGRSVGAVGNPDPRSAIAQAVQYLLAERGLAPRLQLPYAPGEGDGAFMHRDPVHPSGRPMASAIELGGVYVCIEAEVGTLCERVETLADRSGLRVMFSGDWADRE